MIRTGKVPNSLMTSYLNKLNSNYGKTRITKTVLMKKEKARYLKIGEIEDILMEYKSINILWIRVILLQISPIQ